MGAAVESQMLVYKAAFMASSENNRSVNSAYEHSLL